MTVRSLRRTVPVLCVFLLVLESGPPHACLAGDPPQAEDEPGFVPLFNGKDLSGWQGATHIYRVENNAIVCPALSRDAVDRSKTWNLCTDQEFCDFILRFDFRLSPGANSGLGIRVADVQGGNELQIIDNESLAAKGGKPYQFHGSVYGVVPAKQGHQKPAGQWNSQEVVAEGSKLTVKLNGAVIVEANLDEVAKQRSTWARRCGHICFLGHGGPSLEFRNIRIKELK